MNASWGECEPRQEFGRRFEVWATLLLDGEDKDGQDGASESLAALVDVAPGNLAIHLARDGFLSTYRFRLIRAASRDSNAGESSEAQRGWRILFRRWWAAAWGQRLPLLGSELILNEQRLMIQPSWPLDFSIELNSIESAAIYTILNS